VVFDATRVWNNTNLWKLIKYHAWRVIMCYWLNIQGTQHKIMESVHVQILGLFPSSARLSGYLDYQMMDWRNFEVIRCSSYIPLQISLLIRNYSNLEMSNFGKDHKLSFLRIVLKFQTMWIGSFLTVYFSLKFFDYKMYETQLLHKNAPEWEF